MEEDDATAKVIQFATTCPPCKQALHVNCWQYLGEIMRLEHTPCKCDCRGEDGELTVAALTEMARRQPEALARKIHFDTAFERHSSLRFHLRG